VCLDDGGGAAQQERGRERQPAAGGHGQEGAQNHDCDLLCKVEPFGQTRKQIGDDEADQQGDDIAGNPDLSTRQRLS
jgi:hypothetical protein